MYGENYCGIIQCCINFQTEVIEICAFGVDIWRRSSYMNMKTADNR